MSGRVLGFVVAVAAVSAAGLGGYLAGRAPAQTEVTAAPAPVAGSQPAAAHPGAVTETEAAVSEPSPADVPVERAQAAPAPKVPRKEASSVAPKPAPRTAPARRQSAPARAEARPAPEPSPAVVARDETARPAPMEPASRSNSPSSPAADTNATEVATPAASLPPPAPRIEEFVLPADSVIGLQLEDTVSTETARIEQRVQARVTRDVRVNGTVVIPAHSRAQGQVTLVEPGGKFRERARLGVRFHTLVLADGTSVPIQSDVIYREGEAVSGRSAARIGGSAAGGAIIGAIFGGGKGAAIGAAAGAGAGTAATMASHRSHATLNAGSPVTVRLTNPATISVERDD